MARPRRRSAGSLRARQRQRRNRLLRAIGDRPRSPVGSLLLDARLRVLRRRLAVRRELLDSARDRFERFADLLDTLAPEESEREGEEEVETGYSTAGRFNATTLRDVTRGRAEAPRSARGHGATAKVEVAAPSDAGGATEERGEGSTRRLQALFDVFEEMEGEETEFTREGRPKVSAVNDRLESLRQDPANRAEVEQAYETYLRQHVEAPGRGHKLTARERTLWRIFDDMEGEKSEFTQGGLPQVGSVNDRLETLGQEPSSREEIDRAYRLYAGE